MSINLSGFIEFDHAAACYRLCIVANLNLLDADFSSLPNTGMQSAHYLQSAARMLIFLR